MKLFYKLNSDNIVVTVVKVDNIAVDGGEDESLGKRFLITYIKQLILGSRLHITT